MIFITPSSPPNNLAGFARGEKAALCLRSLDPNVTVLPDQENFRLRRAPCADRGGLATVPHVPDPNAIHAAPPLRPVTLVLGGARSGKSAYAESRVLANPVTDGQPPVYLATGQAGDTEMTDRIARHRHDRGTRWETVEEPLALASVLTGLSERTVLVDCLTLWISNLMMAETNVDNAVIDLVKTVKQRSGPIVFVANEVGLGIVPDNPLARAFRDHAGRTNQTLAAHCQTVVFIAAGLPLILKDQV
jgi:adenosylcobinamide kinase/adenosylcobinamide-phosphate guanylyltransferase